MRLQSASSASIFSACRSNFCCVVIHSVMLAFVHMFEALKMIRPHTHCPAHKVLDVAKSSAFMIYDIWSTTRSLVSVATAVFSVWWTMLSIMVVILSTVSKSSMCSVPDLTATRSTALPVTSPTVSFARTTVTKAWHVIDIGKSRKENLPKKIRRSWGSKHAQNAKMESRRTKVATTFHAGVVGMSAGYAWSCSKQGRNAVVI